MKILIKSASASFRRAGIEATRDGVIVDTNDLSPEQIEALQKERMISIGPVAEENGDGDHDGDDESAKSAAEKAAEEKAAADKKPAADKKKAR